MALLRDLNQLNPGTELNAVFNSGGMLPFSIVQMSPYSNRASSWKQGWVQIYNPAVILGYERRPGTLHKFNFINGSKGTVQTYDTGNSRIGDGLLVESTGNPVPYFYKNNTPFPPAGMFLIFTTNVGERSDTENDYIARILSYDRNTQTAQLSDGPTFKLKLSGEIPEILNDDGTVEKVVSPILIRSRE
jgi:hypothetical protein